MKLHYKYCPALIIPSPVVITSSPVNRYPNKLAPDVPNNDKPAKLTWYNPFLSLKLLMLSYLT